MFEFDFFISHASEDKDAIARPLATTLARRGARVWFDEQKISPGDPFSRFINNGIRSSSFAVVIASPAFFAKEWAQKELDAFDHRETMLRQKIILPVIHNMTYKELAEHSPFLASRYGLLSSLGVDELAFRLRHEADPSIILGGVGLSIQYVSADFVGTFSSRPASCFSPFGSDLSVDSESKQFVEPGDPIKHDTTIGVLGAMGIIVEVKAQVSGRFHKFMVEDAACVEFSQPVAQIMVA